MHSANGRDKQTNGRYQVHDLPALLRDAVDKNVNKHREQRCWQRFGMTEYAQTSAGVLRMWGTFG